MCFCLRIDCREGREFVGKSWKRNMIRGSFSCYKYFEGKGN